MTRTSWLRHVWTAACLSAATFATPVSAQADYPSRTIEWVVPYPAGGGTDVVARVLAESMAADLGQPIVIANKPGAATNIGADYVARARPDGHTLLSADTATLAANPSLYSKLSYDAERDLAPVGLTVRFPLILAVHAQVPASNYAELLAWAKAQRTSIDYASPGAGSPHHLAAEAFKQHTGLDLTHIPYRGAAPAVQDVVAGVVPMMFVDTAAGQQFLRSGQLKAIGVASLAPISGFDTVPTLDSQGLPGFEAFAWQGLMVPAGTPVETIGKLHAALTKALADDGIAARFTEMGLQITPSSPEDMRTYAADERVKWGAVIQANGIRVE